jgi:hypothetical protein
MMAKIVRENDNQKALDAAKIIVEKSGAKESILSSKGDVSVKYRSLRGFPASTVYDALVALIDGKGIDGKKEVINDHKAYLHVTGRAGGIIRQHYEN